MLYFLKWMALAAVIISTVGCASIVNGTSQTVTVETWYEKSKVKGAACELKNNKGKYKVITPDVVTVQRMGEDLVVVCEKENYPVGYATAESKWGAAGYGNILAGGLIGAGVDARTGAAYNYPNVIAVQLGKKIIIEDEDDINIVD